MSDNKQRTFFDSDKSIQCQINYEDLQHENLKLSFSNEQICKQLEKMNTILLKKLEKSEYKKKYYKEKYEVLNKKLISKLKAISEKIKRCEGEYECSNKNNYSKIIHSIMK